ncbi:large ribosomal subunit protein bL21m-like [Saccoglossus kowalevskii]|uniref:Large ribosomal subunit protein bL21m n=1 Tax=Saccoglossus kowalevskii TaxID=10224 RepID=A0ABM0GY46_SACKO|nr:PREDICTED: 39S ribosomal protein L21, mitochondrial-like [Saccoglossus kowalevskii]
MAASTGKSLLRLFRTHSSFLQNYIHFKLPGLACSIHQSWSVRSARYINTSCLIHNRFSSRSYSGNPSIDVEDIERRLSIPQEKTNAVIEKVNTDILTNPGRLFAVVYFNRKQYKVTVEDLILSIEHIEADIGEKIRLEKIMMVGSNDFSLIGRPLLSRDMVEVWATVIEKTTTPKQIYFKMKRRKGYKKWVEYKDNLSVLRINSIEITPLKDRRL